MRKTKAGILLFGAMAFFCASQTRLHAQPPSPATVSPELAKIETIVSNLGFTPKTSEDGTYFTIVDNGQRNYNFNCNLSSDKTILYCYSTYNISAEQRARTPYLALLQYNDTHQSYFSITSTQSLIALNMNTPVDGLTPQILRQDFSSLLSNADANQKIFNPENW